MAEHLLSSGEHGIHSLCWFACARAFCFPRYEPSISQCLSFVASTLSVLSPVLLRAGREQLPVGVKPRQAPQTPGAHSTGGRTMAPRPAPAPPPLRIGGCPPPWLRIGRRGAAGGAIGWAAVGRRGMSGRAFCEDSSPLVQVSTELLDEPLSKDADIREPVCQSASSQTSPISVFCYGLEGNKISRDLMNPYEKSEDFAECTSGGHDDLNGKNGIAFVNIDSYEPDSSDGDEEDVLDEYSWLREAAGLIQGRLDNILSQYEKDMGSFNDLESPLSALNHSISRESCEEGGPMPLACPNHRTLKSAEDEAAPKISLSYETQQTKHIVDVGIGTPVPVADVLNIGDGDTDQENSSELVVRPKIRTQNTAKQLEGENYLTSDDEEENDSWRRTGIADVQQCHPECPLRDGKDEMSSGVLFLSRMRSHQKNIETDLRRNALAREQNNVLSDSVFWNELEDHNTHYVMPHKDEDSSEYSDGEWPTSLSSCLTAVENEQSSGDESWETVSSRQEHDPGVQRSSSSVKEESPDFCFQEEQTLLEEGEIAWLRYQEDLESSSDEENGPISDFVHLGLFLLDGNNNLEDDSSVSEDLDVEWRLLDEFGDGLGLAQAIPYMEPQFFTYMALDGHLEAVESALAQLESLTFDVEQTHPPATKETIVSLPQIFVTGQEQCCTICCSEYVEGEIITELPCHHLFHRPCITLWLQRSGTCPVCRHVLAPLRPEAADDSGFF
ncbi:E3 ubiquitin-protein ligase Praja-2 isoform X4 [Taeniopygia guttata]|uniref:E3 ubiquitin-protein ligase Praja-2 isoform X4 n=1 Tax=Taeniopygia guttata TaxID=59729 RepID=UPI003BB88CD4